MIDLQFTRKYAIPSSYTCYDLCAVIMKMLLIKSSTINNKTVEVKGIKE